MLTEEKAIGVMAVIVALGKHIEDLESSLGVERTCLEIEKEDNKKQIERNMELHREIDDLKAENARLREQINALNADNDNLREQLSKAT